MDVLALPQSGSFSSRYLQSNSDSRLHKVTQFSKYQGNILFVGGKVKFDFGTYTDSNAVIYKFKINASEVDL